MSTIAELRTAAETGTYRLRARLADTTQGPMQNGWVGSPKYRSGADLQEALGFAIRMNVTTIELVPMKGDVLRYSA